MPSRQGRKRKLQSPNPEDLPPCEGPKLGIFPKYQSTITWLDRLDNANDQTEHEDTKKAYVFKVKIQSEFYALKVFRGFDPYDEYYYWEGLVKHAKDVEWHTSPFYAECRAYGRINEERARGTLQEEPAIPCFGYIILNDFDRNELEKKGIDTEGSSYGSSDDESFSSRQNRTMPLEKYGIVKKLASEDTGLKERNVRRMQKDIQQLNKLRIYNSDIKKCNYRDSKLVDFGSSWTEPHCYLVPDNELDAKQRRSADLVMFDKMMDKERIITQWRTTPNREYKRRLRSYTGSLKAS